MDSFCKKQQGKYIITGDDAKQYRALSLRREAISTLISTLSQNLALELAAVEGEFQDWWKKTIEEHRLPETELSSNYDPHNDAVIIEPVLDLVTHEEETESRRFNIH